MKQDPSTTIMATDSTYSKEPEVEVEVEPVAGPTQKVEEEEKEEEPKLPKLTPAEFREYNHGAEHMEYFVSRTSYLRNVLRFLYALG